MTVEPIWRILSVEDDEDDYILTRDMLADVGAGKYSLDWVASFEAGKRKILSDAYDAILLDYELGSRTGLELAREVARQGCRSPIILMTGRGNYEIDLEAMQSGVTDYLLKGEATGTLLERSIRYAIQQKQTEEALRSAKAELETRVEERTRELRAQNQVLAAEIRERKRVEAELAEMQRRLFDRVEAERLELARELHDVPMQDLYGLVFQMETLRADIEAGQSEAALETIKARLLQVIQSLRMMSRELRPPSLGPYGLEKAIRSHAELLRPAHPDLQIHLKLDVDGHALPETVRLAMYRIYQTAIANVIRHAKAGSVQVRFSLHPDEAILEVEDDGQGFVLPARWIELARQGHLGLVGAVERAEAIGGSLQVLTEPGEGTLVRVNVPKDCGDLAETD